MKKGSSLWVIKEIRTGGTIKLESPYSIRINCNEKIVTTKGSSTIDFFYRKCIES